MGIDPLSIASMALGGIGSIVSASGASNAAKAQRDQANYQAQVAANNAITANQNADYAAKAGEAQATTQGLKGRNTAAAVAAGLAANGVDINSGSAADVRDSAREAGLLDTQNVRQNAALQSYGYRTQATGFTADQGLDIAKAKNAETAGQTAMFGSLLSGASSLTSKFSKFQDQGIFS